jgi:hypothetical protein
MEPITGLNDLVGKGYKRTRCKTERTLLNLLITEVVDFVVS